MSYKFTRLYVDDTVISADGHALHRLVKYPATEGLSYSLVTDKGTYYVCNGRGTAKNTNIVIADTIDGIYITEIAGYAFKNTNNANADIVSVVVPDMVTTIGLEAFKDCTGLVKITFDGNSSLTSIPQHGFQGCVSLERITIPDTVTETKNGVFDGCSGLTKVIFKENSQLATIGNQSFRGCTSLTSIALPAGVTSIGSEVFSGCTNLTDITIPESVTALSHNAFENCTSLTRITIPGGVNTIYSNTFAGCSNLTDLHIDNGVRTIYPAFSGCDSLTSLILPSSAQVIYRGALAGCDNLSSLTLSKVGCSYTGSWHDEYFGCIFDKGTDEEFEDYEWKYYLASCVPASLKTVTLADGLLKIPMLSFAHCDTIENIIIEDSVTEIDVQAFYDCRGLSSVVIGRGVTVIGSHAFESCTHLESITYAGTMAEWNAIEKRAGWNSSVPATFVVCSDGNVNI